MIDMHVKPLNRKYTILIVDDQPINIQAIYSILANEYEVYMATSGEEAIQLSTTMLIDLFLIDINMPVMNGLELCHRLKSNNLTNEALIIFITASDNPDNESLCWDAGGADFVTKPVNPKTLKKRISYHLMMKKQTQLLQSLSFVDGLTGVFNRRFFDAQLNTECRNLVRTPAPLSLIMIDVDFFKKYNDNYGHQAGDECLKVIAATLSNSLHRPFDIIARYGGDEFVCLLPDTDDIGALHVAKRCEKAVHLLKLPHAHSTASEYVTLSFGVASALDCKTLTPNQLLALADTQLYEAKKNGRARIFAAKIQCSV